MVTSQECNNANRARIESSFFLPITVVGEMRILAVLQISGIAVIRCPSFLVEAVDVRSEMIKVDLVVDFALVSSWPKLSCLAASR